MLIRRCGRTMDRFHIWTFSPLISYRAGAYIQPTRHPLHARRLGSKGSITTPLGWDAIASKATQYEVTRSITTLPGWDASRLRVASNFDDSGEIHTCAQKRAPARRRATRRGAENYRLQTKPGSEDHRGGISPRWAQFGSL